jgi:hypothetical protein
VLGMVVDFPIPMASGDRAGDSSFHIEFPIAKNDAGRSNK